MKAITLSLTEEQADLLLYALVCGMNRTARLRGKAGVAEEVLIKEIPHYGQMDEMYDAIDKKLTEAGATPDHTHGEHPPSTTGETT